MGGRSHDEKKRDLARARMLYEDAKRLIRSDRLREAIEFLNEALRLNPTFTDSLVLRGVTNGHLRNDDAALADLDEAIAASAYVNPLAFVARAEICARCGNHTQAIADYSAVIKRQPDDTRSWNARGVSALAIGDWPGAVLDFTKALQLRPGFAAAHVQRGDAYAQSNRPVQAIADYDAAIAAKNDWPDAVRAGAVATTLTNRSLARQRLGDRAGALADLGAAIESKPSANAFCSRANLHKDDGDLSAAIRDYTSAVELDPHCVRAYNGRGIVYGMRGEPFEAIRNFDLAIEVDPDDVPAYQNRAQALRMLRRYEEALNDVEQALTRAPASASALIMRAVIQMDAGDADAALQDLDAALAIDPKATEALIERARAYVKLDIHDRAVHDCTAALRLAPDDPRALIVRGNVRLLKRRYRQAIGDLTRAIEVDPRSARAHTLRGRAYVELGQPALAQADFDVAARLDPSLETPRVAGAIAGAANLAQQVPPAGLPRSVRKGITSLARRVFRPWR